MNPTTHHTNHDPQHSRVSYDKSTDDSPATDESAEE